jgi:putative transcriptional regulator
MFGEKRTGSIGLPLPEHLHHKTVYFGGPVQTERGFVLHTPPHTFSSTLTVSNAVSLTTSKDVLEAVSQGAGPDKFMVSLVFGWHPLIEGMKRLKGEH